AEDTPSKRRMRRFRQALRNADRHDVALAAARALRRRLPGDERYGDPLSVGGRAPAELLGARLALMAGESPSALKELGFGALQVAGHRPQLRAGLHFGRPRHLGGDYFGVDVNVAARITDAAGPGEVLVSGALLARLDDGAVSTHRRRPLRAKGAPAETEVFQV